MQNRGNKTVAELYEQLDADEQWRQLTARVDRRRWLALVLAMGVLGVILYYLGDWL